MALHNINAAAVATLYKNHHVVGTVAATPNAVAYGFAKTGATHARSSLGDEWVREAMVNRVKNAGWLVSDAAAGLSRA